MKNTKKALLLSVMSLLLCVSMLVGTTFAWFTDSVSTGKNTIAAGNLDVQLFYKLNANDNWAEVDTDTELFDDAALWEPGYTQVVYLKVLNAGSLALKYQLGLNIVSETQGKNVDGNMFSLSDYIEFDAIETDAENFYADRKAAREAATNSKIISAGYSKASELEKNGDDDYVALVVYMPETVDNKANYRDIQPKISLGLKLVATQLEAEEDSFDETYDKDAWADGMEVRSEQDLRAALNNGETVIILMDSFSVAAPVEIPAGASIALNLNGKTISAPSGNVFVNKGTLEIEGEGTIQSATTYGVNNSGELTVTDASVNAIFNAGKLTANNVTVANTISGKHGIYHGGTALTINGGTYSSTSGNELIHAAGSNVTINGGEFNQIGKSYLFGPANAGIVINGGTFNGYVNADSSNDKMRPGAAKVSGGTFNFDPTAWLESGYKAIESNGMYVVVPENVDNVIATAADLYALSGTQINGTWALMADIDMTGYDMKPIMLTSGSANVLTFQGNGHTISNLNLVEDTQNGMPVSGLFNTLHSGSELNISDLTLDKVTSTSGKYSSALVAYNSSSLTINLNDVDVKNATVEGESAAALVCYSTGAVNLTDCDVSGLELDGLFEENKVGAYIGTANTDGCVVTVTNCTNNSEYRDFGRVINGATWNGGLAVSDTNGLIDAIKSAPVGQVTTIQLAGGTYAGDITFTTAAMGKQAGDVVIKAMDGAKPVYTGLITLGEYEIRTTNVSLWDASVAFEGITFRQAEALKDSIIVENVKKLSIKKCAFVDGGEYGAHGVSGGIVKEGTTIEACDFENSSLQPHGNFGTNLLIKGCTFTESNINFQGGNGATIEGCTFKNTLTDANDGESFYAVRTNSTPVTITGCKFDVDCTASAAAVPGSKGWAVFVNRGTTNWTIDGIELNMTDAAVARTELEIDKCTNSGKINMTNWKLNGVEQP